jgi:hypothetical protein
MAEQLMDYLSVINPGEIQLIQATLEKIHFGLELICEHFLHSAYFGDWIIQNS